MTKIDYKIWLTEGYDPLVIGKAIATDKGSELEWMKIQELKKEAWNMAVEMMLERLKNKITNKHEWIEIEIQNVKEWITNHPKERQNFIDNRIALSHIDGQRYTHIKHEYSKFKSGVDTAVIIEAKSEDGSFERSDLWWMHVQKAYLKSLEEIESEFIDTDTKKIIDVATSGGKVQKKHKEHARNFMAKYALIKKESPGLNIEVYIKEVGMTKLSNNTYRNWIEKFNEAEQMLSDVK
ncbi:hypothetical protein [Gracilimonas mengyeensis]|uniref:Uncharacterized protein n=1 Tax=Gracilimonas mengyeensis TaxID=1302730 RepID=A0A521EK03_9BACT|nr:hypothetical protein [Gracilimonas mengyeensis]SMO84233.1 hypothetical protein SAMN06265219_11294 [Gracilimonas mengyeensis]